MKGRKFKKGKQFDFGDKTYLVLKDFNSKADVYLWVKEVEEEYSKFIHRDSLK